MGALILDAVLGGDGGGVAAADDADLAAGDGGDEGVEGGLGARGELVELEDAGGAVPEDGLGAVDGLLEEADRLRSAVEALPPVGDALGVRGGSRVSILGELVGRDVVDGQRDFHAVLLGLLHQAADGPGPGLVEERVPDPDALERLLERERHAAADHQRVYLVQQVVDQLDLVRHLGPAQDRQEWPLWRLDRLREVVQLLLHQEPGRLLRQVHAYHRRVCAVRGAEGVVYMEDVC